MKAVAIGTRPFASGFMLSGVAGIEVQDSGDALIQINRLMGDKEVGLIIVSDDISRPIRDELTDIRSKQPIPLIYEIPAPGSKQEKVDYRDLIKRVLKMA